MLSCIPSEQCACALAAPTRPADLFLECPFKNEITCVVQTSAVQRAPCSHPVARIQLLKVPATDGHHKHLADSPFPACPSNWTRRGPHQARCLGVAPCNTRLYQFRLGPGTEAAGLRCVASCVSGAGSSLLTSMNQTACGKAASALEGQCRVIGRSVALLCQIRLKCGLRAVAALLATEHCETRYGKVSLKYESRILNLFD